MVFEHESVFSYNITRAYPFRWFTPVVLVGFLVTTVLFSFLNFASNGYDLIVETSSNPNQTISEGIWFKNWPSYLTSKAKPSCQPADIHVNTLLFTNQTALTYTLTDVWRVSAGGGNRTVLPSLTYYNNRIENCAVSSVEVDLEALDRAANQLAYAEWGAVVRAYISCTIEGAEGQTRFNLTTTYDYVPQSASLSGLYQFLATNFLDRDKQKKSSLYWGESLMSMYWAYMTKTMQDIRQNATDNNEAGIRKGTISFTPNNSSTSDITRLDYFKVDYRFMIDDGLGDFSILWPGLYNWTNSVAYLDRISAKPNIWIQADSLAKSAYSTILTDLGQISSTPNILTDDDTLQYFTSNFSIAMVNKANAEPGPATQDFDTLKATTGPLGVTPSVISTNYICQIPKLKSGGNLFVSVLVADLVFLQALWKIFTLVTDWLLFRKHPNANQCHGCAENSSRHGPLTSSLGKNSRVHVDSIHVRNAQRCFVVLL
ncbi:uncharacterized protein BDZ99DRAFT_512276 [Mytilinidion resinicola]|uniref:Uncharacterized protein n=1 Tax=Mytilinidion resinicola TaxID=574789 RepID=A0A6A6Y3I9_9PEZI|nr:uncharacterized protein BDZ99DRAFT_512276 [Mytilinidion resinicola]KAF2803199.1 hypothetical protein BDZ99DRAFT_512276 [Mytilinidion resinicola]